MNKKIKLKDLWEGDIFVLRKEIAKEVCNVFLKLPLSPWYSAIRLSDGRPYTFHDYIEVIKLKLK